MEPSRLPDDHRRPPTLRYLLLIVSAYVLASGPVLKLAKLGLLPKDLIEPAFKPITWLADQPGIGHPITWYL